MIVSEITLYNVLKAKLGEQDAQTVVEGIKQEVKERVYQAAFVFLVLFAAVVIFNDVTKTLHH